ncbi:ECF transporter S component [Clostridium sp. MD294]|uniref:ECF transporter S component n=1 Tax=Clostridium sp. MD294 TaxID=97138 RepID=UPI0002CCCCFB|nr:ECF transporter S component [Clostridium sp. MD294]USF29345.1 Riboflavin transporter RibU [Clostridium sp. MD294]
MENIKSVFLSIKSKPQKEKQKMTIRQMVGMAMLAAISIVFVSVIHFPLFPAAAFLEYDPADIPILIGTFAYGPIAGFILTVVVSLIQGITVSAGSGIIGIIMHIVATGSCTLISGTIYQKMKTKKGAAISLSIGVIIMTFAMVFMNLILTPLFMGAPVETVIAMLVPIFIPFNLLKYSINCLITFLLYKSISHILKGVSKK